MAQQLRKRGEGRWGLGYFEPLDGAERIERERRAEPTFLGVGEP